MVNGSEPYEVLVKCSEGKLAVSCTCPYFLDQGQTCKHLWAAILSADEEGYLSDVTAAKEQSSRLLPFPLTLVRARQAPAKPPPLHRAGKCRWAALQALRRRIERNLHRGRRPGRLSTFWMSRKARGTRGVVLTIATREQKREGGWKSIPKPCSILRARIASLPLAEDRELISMLLGGEQYSFGYFDSYDRGVTTFSLSSGTAQTILPRVVGTGRCLLPFERDETEKSPLQWDDGEPWKFVLEVRGSQMDGWQLTGSFRRGAERMGIDEPLLAIPGGFLFTGERVARLAEDETFPWIAGLRNNPVTFSEEEREEFFSQLICSPALPALELPEQLRYEEVTISPRKCLKISQPGFSYKKEGMSGELSFEYEGRSVPALARGIYEASARRFIRRDLEAEKAASVQLSELGLRIVEGRWGADAVWALTPTKLPRVVRALVESGWKVVAEGKAFRQPGQSSVSVASGVDWFELHGAIEYGETTAQLPQLLAALKRGESMVPLSDGSYGLLPEEWLRRFGPAAAMGEAEGDHIRFRSSQVGVLDALLATQPAVNCDEAFQRVRQQLARFESVTAAEQPAGFQGRLRDYQREGLGWMHFLRQFSFGGCLADDMGVGKTAQVLALLETRREFARERRDRGSFAGRGS